MARLRVPQSARAPLSRLAGISPEEFKSIIEILQSEEPLLARRDLIRRLRERSNQLDGDDLKDFLDVALSLATLRADEGSSVEQLADDVSSSTDLKVPDDARPTLKERLITVLQVSSVQQLSKAADLLSRDERVFHDLRITTDMRPIFEEDPSEIPAGALIVHNFKIEFHTTNGLQEWQVSLDESDLVQLRQVVDRAVEKARSLHKLMENTHLIAFEPADQA